MIDGAYKSMIEQEQYVGEFVSKNYKKKFEYCQETDYKYDHKDYYNIPGLCYDEEHSILYFFFTFEIKLSLFIRICFSIIGLLKVQFICA